MKNKEEIKVRIRAYTKVRGEVAGPVTKGEKRTISLMIGELLWIIGNTGQYKSVRDLGFLNDDDEPVGVRNEEQIREYTKAHLEEGLDECRWCFAVDLKRVKAIEIARYDFPDSALLHLYCLRCGGEFSQYINGWGDDYMKERINELHPELGGKINDEFLGEVHHRVLFPDNLGEYLGD